jgi:hypothetical protein
MCDNDRQAMDLGFRANRTASDSKEHRRRLTLARVLLGAIVPVLGCTFGLPDYPDPPADAGIVVTPPEGGIADTSSLPCGANVSGFQLPTWHPPQDLHRSLCSADQVRLLADCVPDLYASPSACQMFRQQLPANESCFQCAVSSSLAPRYGPMVNDGQGLVYQNVGGCVAALANDVSNTGCGAIVDANGACSDYACRACNTPQDYSNCSQVATTTLCGQYDSRCADKYIDQCLGAPGVSYKESLVKIITLFCVSG